MKNYLLKSASYLCASCDYEMIRICIVMMFVFLGINLMLGQLEILIVGEVTPTWLDPLVVLLLMAYTTLCSYVCAIKLTEKKEK